MLDGTDLTGEEMQRLARRMDLSGATRTTGCASSAPRANCRSPDSVCGCVRRAARRASRSGVG
ncbi:hypothetical protein [Streptomyces sp. NPDC052036]|uniref:hypothetical protein n=1 Tax=unclassified Streptomyces TaxID=2593676 RepID=UPI0034383665